MTNPLAPLKYGKVVGRLLAGIIDSADVGPIPDFPPLSGRVTFAAAVPKYLVPNADPPATVAPLTHPYYTATLDGEGYLTWRGKRGVYLAAPVSGTMNPAGWTWRVSFDLEYDGVPVQVAAFNIEVPEYIPGPDEENPDEGSVGLVDLALASPVPSSNGNAVVRGLSVVSVDLDGTAIVFGLDDGTFLDPVDVPAIEDATDAAAAAAASATAAEDSADAAEAAVNSFSLTVGTVTTVDPGDPATVDIHGGPPAWTADFEIPQGETGATGPPAPDADATTKGIIMLPGSAPGELGGTAETPTVTGWSGKSDVGHTHTATDVSDSTSVGRSVLTAADAAAARTAIGAGTSSLTLGTTGGTACAGNDSRLSDTRTPTTGTQYYDMSIPAFGKSTTRAAGTGDFPFGVKLQRAATFTSVTYRANTADASGNLVVKLQKNGSDTGMSGSSATIAAANQVAGGTATGTWSFAAGDILTVVVVSVGTTPGTGLIADITGLA